MTVIVQDDHLTAGAWAACVVTRQKWGGESIFKDIAIIILRPYLHSCKEKKKKKNSTKKFRSGTDKASIKKSEKLHVTIKE